MSTTQDESPTPFTEEGAKKILADSKRSAYAIINDRHKRGFQHNLDFVTLAKNYFKGAIKLPWDGGNFNTVLAEAFEAAEDAAKETMRDIDTALDEKALETANRAARKKILAALGGPLGLNAAGSRPRATTQEVVSLIEALMQAGPVWFLDSGGKLIKHPGKATLTDAQEIAADVTGVSSRTINTYWAKRCNTDAQKEAVMATIEKKLGIADSE